MSTLVNAALVLTTLIYFEQCDSVWVSAGQSYSFVCEANKQDNFSIVWQVNFQTLFFCDIISTPLTCVPAFDELQDIYEPKITSDTLTVTSTLKIKSVVPYQDNSIVYCRIGSKTAVSSLLFALNVFSPPESPSCLNVTLVEDISVKVQCVTEKAFPDAMCVFHIKTNNTEAIETGKEIISYQSKPSNSSGYNRTECSFTVAADSLGPGSHVFYVVMYPNITANITEEMKSTSQYTIPIKIGYPEAVLAPDCQVNVYIRENQNRTCTCYDSNPTFLPTQVTWSIGGDQKGRLLFVSKRHATENIIYTCSISNKLSWTNQIQYDPNVTYGPDNAFLTLPNLIIDQCDIDAANISGTCTVSETIPVPNVYIYVSNSPVMSQHQINTNDFHFSHVVSESGIAYVLCRAVNPVFEEISSESINYITVKGPPSTPLISSVSSQGKSLTNGNQLPVTEGNIDIFCESKGGFPLYKNITLVCGACRKSNENSDTISMTLSISSGMQGMNCTCVVSHESKCLHNFVKVSLNILKDEQNNVGAIVGGTIAAVFGAVLIAVVTVFIVRRRLKKFQTNSQAKHVNKMQTYSNVQAREDYSNSESHQYERPNFKPGPSIEVVISSPHLNSTPDLSIQPDVHTLTDIRQLKLKSNPDKFSLGGFIVHDGLTQRQFAEENTDITAHECQDEDTDGQKEKHHYEEIDDINVISRDTKDNKTEEKSKPELNSFYVNV